MEEAIISSEKVAVTFVVRSTPVASALGTVLMTVGAVVSVLELVIVQERLAGVGSAFPARSVACTSNL